MTKKWIAINLFLLLLAGITGRQLYISVRQFKAENDLSKIEPDRSLSQKAAQETILPPPPANRRYNASDFAVISEKNLFLESRRNDASGESPVSSGNMPASQKPLLVGVVLTENQKVASLLEPVRRGRKAEVQLKRVGDTYDGYTVTDIASDHIVLDNGSQKEIISLEAGATPQRGRTNFIPTRVVPIGGGAITGNIPVTIVAGRTGTPQSSPVSTVRTTNSRTNVNTRNNVIPVSGVPPGSQEAAPSPQGNAQPQGGTQTAKPQSSKPAPGGVQRNPRVIRTPFGEILRPEP